jgi:hypothetical protein
VAVIAILPLAGRMGHATEQLGGPLEEPLTGVVGALVALLMRVTPKRPQ